MFVFSIFRLYVHVAFRGICEESLIKSSRCVDVPTKGVVWLPNDSFSGVVNDLPNMHGDIVFRPPKHQ